MSIGQLPKGALALAVLGLLLLGYALFTAGDDIVVQGGSYVARDAIDSDIQVTPPVPPPPAGTPRP